MKPILFNTEMVKAILDGRKTVTRRLIKGRIPLNDWNFYKLHDNKDGAITCGKDKLCAGFYKDRHIFYMDGERHIDAHYYCAPYKPRDVLYVRETWAQFDRTAFDNYLDYPSGRLWTAYKADGELRYNAGEYIGKISGCENFKWRPSIHMPKEAARIFLKVTDVRVERLQDITNAEARKEGAETEEYLEMQEEAGICGLSCQSIRDYFGTVIWNSTIKKRDLPLYGWEANPWVWVVEFERCEKPESEG